MRRVMVRAMWMSASIAGAGCSDAGTATRASEVSYEAPAGLKSTTVQGALDELASQQAAQAGVVGRTEALESTVAGLMPKVEAHEAALVGLPERVEALEQSPPPGAEAISATGPGHTVQEGLTALDSTAQSLDARLVVLEAALEAAQVASATERAAAQERIEALEARVDALESDAAGRSARLATLEEDLDAKWKAPRPCPDGLVAVSPETCIESKLRPADYTYKALAACRNDGLRLCHGDEVMEVCGRGWVDEIEDTVGFIPEWTSDIVERVPLDVSDGLYEAALGAIGGTNACNFVKAAGTAKMAPGTTTVKFPYRCCASR